MITKKQAMRFYADVLGEFRTKGNDAIVSAELIAERLGISLPETETYLRACAKYGITERQGGGWVI